MKVVLNSESWQRSVIDLKRWMEGPWGSRDGWVGVGGVFLSCDVKPQVLVNSTYFLCPWILVLQNWFGHIHDNPVLMGSKPVFYFDFWSGVLSSFVWVNVNFWIHHKKRFLWGLFYLNVEKIKMSLVCVTWSHFHVLTLPTPVFTPLNENRDQHIDSHVFKNMYSVIP